MRSDTRLNQFGDYTHRRWNTHVGKLMLSIGVPCPNRQRGGCVYCAAESFTPYYLHPTDSLPGQMAKGKRYLRRFNTRLFFASFQNETSTAGSVAELVAKFQIPLADPDCVGLIVSTRPDCLTQDQLKQLVNGLAAFPDKKTIFELGLQSAREASLAFLNRNHTVQDFIQAVHCLRNQPSLEWGVHLILGLPGETLADMRETLRLVADLGVQHLKFHHLQIVKGTRLHELYQADPFALPDVTQYFDWLGELLPLVPKSTVIHRLWGTCKPSLLCAPRWGLHSGQLHARLRQLLIERNIVQGSRVDL